MAYLLIVSPPHRGELLPLRQERATIGRIGRYAVAVGDVVVLCDQEVIQVSRHHAQIVRRGSDFYVRDGDEHQGRSRHGTLLNPGASDCRRRQKPYRVSDEIP